MASQQVDTRTTHTITILLDDDIISRIEHGDDIEVIFNSRVSTGRVPRPFRLSYSMVNWIMGWT